ncbi:MAG: glycosyltransferase family 4 protein [Chloroflexota bacterium]|nr:glycosyltransferase family 4 protein [Chloroflexota bacterium]
MPECDADNNEMDALHGLVVLNSLRRLNTGASRPIKLVYPYLHAFNVHLHYSAARSLLHFLHSLTSCGRIRYDFVVFNGLSSLSHRSLFGPTLARALLAVNVPVFIYWHETDWVLDRHRQEHPASARTVREIGNHPSVTHLTVSKAGASSVSDQFPGATATVVHNCTTISAPFDQPVRPSSPPYVINLASIQERKGTDLFVETAIRVCNQHPSVEFIWLGDGEPYGTWREDVRKSGLEHRILFPGYVDSAYLLLRRASVFFLSSRDDPFPLSNLEAMCLGRTIVTFDVGGAPEALGGHGTVIAPFDTQASAEAISNHLRRPPEQLVDEAVRQRYLRLYTPEKFAARLNRCIRERVFDGQ